MTAMVNPSLGAFARQDLGLTVELFDAETERDKLLRQQTELQEEQKKLESRQAELSESEKTRTTLLRRLSDMKDVRFTHRTEVAESLNSQLSPTIRVTIEQYGNTDHRFGG